MSRSSEKSTAGRPRDGNVVLSLSGARDGKARYPSRLFAPGDLVIERGRSLAILGPSGSGKTTLLRILAGIVETAGWADWPGRAAFSNIGLMAQNGDLFPWFTVADNISVGARLRGEPVDHNRRGALLERIGLAGIAAEKPHILSGGMRQRVALARALYEDATLILLDEPFSSLDAITRRQMQQLTREATAGRTLVLVTHDPDEAMLMGDRVVLLEGTPTRFIEVDKSDGAQALWSRVLRHGTDETPVAVRA